MGCAGLVSPAVEGQGVSRSTELLRGIGHDFARGSREVIWRKPQVAQGADLQGETEAVVVTPLALCLVEVRGREREVLGDILQRDLRRKAPQAFAFAIGQK